MSGTTAADWAERADPTALAVRVDELDRRALGGLPEARDALVALGTRSARELEEWRERRLERLREEDPAVAATLRPRGGVTCGFIVASLAVAVAYALFFSRGNLGLEIEVIASAAALAVGTAIVAVVLPWSRRRPVTAGDATLSCIVAGLGGAAAFATVRQAGFGDGLAVPAGIAAACGVLLVVMAAVTTVRRLRIPRADRQRQGERVEAVRAEFSEEVARVRAAGGEEVDAALAAADPAAVAAAQAEVDAAYEVLRRRGLVDRDAAPHRPGRLLVDVPVGRAAQATRMPDAGRLVPALAPRR
ncbi:MAG TPA: hypothetical protein VFS72_12650 [Agromyces sp.]|nr:hypothetical protein [Agromyces sp.]